MSAVVIGKEVDDEPLKNLEAIEMDLLQVVYNGNVPNFLITDFDLRYNRDGTIVPSDLVRIKTLSAILRDRNRREREEQQVVERDASLKWNNRSWGVFGAVVTLMVSLAGLKIGITIFNKRSKSAAGPALEFIPLVTTPSVIHLVVLSICLFLVIAGIWIDHYNAGVIAKINAAKKIAKTE